MLEATEVGGLLEHLRRGSVELAQPVDDLGRRLARRLLAREKPAVEPLEPAVEALVNLGQTAVEALLHRAEAAFDQLADRPHDDGAGDRDGGGQTKGEQGSPHRTCKR